MCTIWGQESRAFFTYPLRWSCRRDETSLGLQVCPRWPQQTQRQETRPWGREPPESWALGAETSMATPQFSLWIPQQSFWDNSPARWHKPNSSPLETEQSWGQWGLERPGRTRGVFKTLWRAANQTFLENKDEKTTFYHLTFFLQSLYLHPPVLTSIRKHGELHGMVKNAVHFYLNIHIIPAPFSQIWQFAGSVRREATPLWKDTSQRGRRLHENGYDFVKPHIQFTLKQILSK